MTTESRRRHVWERSYPPGLDWGADLHTGSLGNLLDGAIRAFSGRTALEYLGRGISYEQLGAQVEATRRGFATLGISAGDHVALLLPNCPAHPIAFFAAAKAGATVVHVSPLDSERIQRFKLADSGAKVLVTSNHPAVFERAAALLDSGAVDTLIVADDARFGWPPTDLCPIPQQDGLIPLSRFLDAPHDERLPIPLVDPDAIVLLQYTGGTTGRPKGAMLTHRNLTAAVASYDYWNRGQGVHWPDTERIVCVLPLFHIFALSVILLRGLRNGAEILLRPRFDIETTLSDVSERRATGLPGVPTMWIAISNYPGIERVDFSSLSLISSGGAPLPIEVAERFRRLTGLTLRNGWGMTETSPAGTNNPRHIPPKPGSIGVPLPGIEIDIVAIDDPRRVLPLGEVGELRIRGPNVTRGYWNRPNETAASFVDDRFLTGDIGYMDADGYIFLVDRKTDLIISGGFNVYPQMIEQAIYEHPSVEEVLVLGVPDTYRGESAKAFVKLRSGHAPITLESLQAFLADKVGRHEMPQALEIRERLPRTPVGKLSKSELRAEQRRERGEA